MSIVCKGREGEFQVRARDQQDLMNICQLIDMPRSRIRLTPGGDYCCRLIVTATELSQIFTALQETIDYPNYKDAVARRADQAKKIGPLHDIWHIMASTQSPVPWSGLHPQRTEPSSGGGERDDTGEEFRPLPARAPKRSLRRARLRGE